MPTLCHINDINNNQGKGFNLDGLQIVAIKKYDQIHIYKNSCPHLGIQLEMVPDQFLDSSDSLIMCSMHGALFRIEDGYCVSGPCLDQSLQAIPFRIEGEHIIVDT